MGCVYFVVLDRDVAAEITHDAFLRLWEHYGRLPAGSDEKAWLIRVATNLAISHPRSQGAAYRRHTDYLEPADPGLQALNNLDLVRVRRALLMLEPRDRAVISLRFDGGLGFAEIGAIVGKPENTVKTRFHRSLETLRRELGDAGAFGVDSPTKKDQMADHGSLDQQLTDFYHGSRVAMSGPVPRWDPAKGYAAPQGWGRQLLLTGAGAIFILAFVAAASIWRENQASPAGQNHAVTSPPATPQPSPTPSAFTASCKLPVSWGDATGHMSGGFVSFPGASFAPDSRASGLTSPFGATWVSYDTSMRRWVPADRVMLSPDGATWLYGALRNGNEYHAVDVSTGTDTTLWGSDKFFHVIGLDNKDAYAMLDGIGGAHLWRLPLDGSEASQVRVGGSWQFVNGGALWGTGAASLPAGAPFSLQRLDLQKNTVATWVQLSGPGSLVGFDGRGAPIVQVGGGGGDIIVAPSPGVQRPVARAFSFAKGPDGIAQLPAVGDSYGIWLPGTDGLYVSVNGVASKQSSVQAFPAGPCS